MGKFDALAVLECASAKYHLNWSDRSLLEVAAQYLNTQRGLKSAFERFVERVAKAEATRHKMEEGPTQPGELSFRDWCVEADRLFRKKTCCTWGDLCGDDGPREQAYQNKETPGEFVRWFCEKYGVGGDDD